jgi:hypothetical protein
MAGSLRITVFSAAILALSVGGTEAAAPAPAAGANLGLPYPAKSLVVVHVNGFERSRERLAKMLEALPPANAKQIKKGIDDGLAELLKNRKLDAVPKEARIFVVLHNFDELVAGEPPISVLLPVTGYKDFKDTLLTADERKSVEKAGNGIESMKTSATGDEQTLYLVELKVYVARTPSKNAAETYAGKYTPAQSAAMGPDLSACFLAADVSLYVNMDVINDLYGDQIRQFKGLIDFALGQAQNMGMIPGLGKKQLELAKIGLNGLAQGI